MKMPQNGKYQKRADIFWTNLETIMKVRGIAWKDLAEKIGSNPHTLAAQKCVRTNVSIGAAADIAEAVGTSVDRLVFGNPNEIN